MSLAIVQLGKFKLRGPFIVVVASVVGPVIFVPVAFEKIFPSVPDSALSKFVVTELKIGLLDMSYITDPEVATVTFKLLLGPTAKVVVEPGVTKKLEVPFVTVLPCPEIRLASVELENTTGPEKVVVPPKLFGPEVVIDPVFVVLA